MYLGAQSTLGDTGSLSEAKFLTGVFSLSGTLLALFFITDAKPVKLDFPVST